MTTSHILCVKDQIISKLNEIRKTQGISYELLAEKAALSKGAVYQALKNRGSCNITTFIKICFALNVNYLELVAQGFGKA